LAEQSPQDILLRNAIYNLDTSKPVNAIMQDMLLNDLYNPDINKIEDEYEFDESIFGLLEEDINSDGSVTKTASDLYAENTAFDYNDYSHPDYLSNVAGKTITMPDGEVRTYSPDGSSYSIPAESWMGVGDSTYQITTHNQLSGMAYPEPNRQYVGISFNQARPAITAAVTPSTVGKTIALSEYGWPSIQGALGSLLNRFKGSSEDTDNSVSHSTSHGSATSTGKVY
tara:strand:+ start:782 stop:1462 length:681 start_codon:yes stop_codon:yes gene_type:complete